MQEANDNRVNAVNKLSSDDSHIYDNKKAKFILKQDIGKSKNLDVVVLSSDQNLLMINKKTGYGFFAHFD